MEKLFLRDLGQEKIQRSVRRGISEAGRGSVWLLKLFVAWAIGVLGAGSFVSA